MATAMILGGTGQTGRAAAVRLARDGWDLTLAARHAPPPDLADFRFCEMDRHQPGALAAADGVDVLIDLLAYIAADAQSLVALAGRVGSVIVMSSAAVYDTTDLQLPITEEHATVSPADDDYAGRKRRIEEMLLAVPELAATLLRAGAIYGPWSPNPPEWYFVKRVLDNRPCVVLAWRGESRFQPVSVHNLAELIARAAHHPAARVLNGADPYAPTALEIGRIIAGAMGHEWHELLLPGAEQGVVGDHPWNVPPPGYVHDMSAAARELGYVAATMYADAVGETIDWLVTSTRTADWRHVIRDSHHLAPLFDYAAEDAYITALARP